MLVRTKVILTLLLVTRSYKQTKVVVEDGDFQDGCTKSEANFHKVDCKCRLFAESYVLTTFVSWRGQNRTPNIQSSLLFWISGFLNEKINCFYIETELPDTFFSYFHFPEL